MTTLVDSFGRKTIFEGTELVKNSSDNGRKPSWIEVTVWKTGAGNYVVLRITKYRVTHASATCEKAEGFDLVEAGEEDSYNCLTCNRNGTINDPGWAQADRVHVNSYRSPQALAEGFQERDGSYSNFSSSILSFLAKKDKGIDRAWSVVHVA